MRKRISRNVVYGVVLSLALIFILTASVLAMIGDINLDDLVNIGDLNLVKQSLGTNDWSGDPNWNPFADLDMNNKVDVADLAIAGRSYGSTRNFHYPRQVSNTGTAYNQDTCIDGLDRLNIIWSSSTKVYFSRLDRFGNTLIDDVWLDNVSSTTDVAVGCDEAGDAHVIWKCPDGLYQARFDRWGYPVISPKVAYNNPPYGSSVNQLAIDLDSQGNPHVFFEKSWRNVQTYARFDTEGKFVMGSQGQLAGSTYTSTPWRDIALDSKDNVHLIWYETVYPDRIYYARYSTGDTPAITDTIIGTTGYDSGYNGSQVPALALDPDDNAFILYPNATIDQLLLEKIDPDGNTLLHDFNIFPGWEIGGYTPNSELELDQHGNLHLFSITGFGKGGSHSAYGSFDNDGAPLYPMRWVLYGNPASKPKVVVDSQDDVHFTYSPNYPTSYPSCPDLSMCYQGTAFDPDAYDRTRPDLGVDGAHLDWTPTIARWHQSLVITGTVFNAGWYTATATTVRVSLLITDTDETPQASTNIAIVSLAPRQTDTFTATLDLPDTPPVGLEELEYLRLRLEVDHTDMITETTESNNVLSIPILVQKIPTKTGLFLMVRDDTETVRGGNGQWVNTGIAGIKGENYAKEIPVTSYQTVLGNDIPVENPPNPITYTISWEAEHYNTPATAQITVVRDADPYVIDYDPRNTAVLVTDRWGSLSGTISKSDGGGGALEGATLRLVGQRLSIEAVTDASGNYSSTSEPKLGKLIPGQYNLRLIHAGYERITDTIVIDSLEMYPWSKTMDPTVDAYLHGSVGNDFGNPVVGAHVEACGITTTTDSLGVFDMTVIASCSLLEITGKYYEDYSEAISLTAGLEEVLSVTMVFDPPLHYFSASDKVGSRVINQSTGGLLPDPPDDAGWFKEKIVDEFKGTFWADFTIYIVYGGYAYNAAAGYSGGAGDYAMNYVQLSLSPKTFEVHMLLTSVSLAGVPIPVPLVDDSGERSALRVIEARLVNTATGHVIETIYEPEEEGYDPIIEDTTLTYDFDGRVIDDLANTEVWVYYKVGKNVGGKFQPMPQLYQYDKQIMKFDLDTDNIWIDYGLGEFPQ
jgi:hypothetical protein